MKVIAGAALALMLLASSPGLAAGQSENYEAAVAKWTSYQDVAAWLEANFAFDRGRLDTILERTRQNGPAGLLARNAAATFEGKRGYCTDSANFAIQALNRINPDYQAKYIFIKNQYGQPHHWVTGFMVGGKVMVMDYGASQEWAIIKGVHGPYDSLDQYAAFLSGLGVKKFAPASVEWRANFPGTED